MHLPLLSFITTQAATQLPAPLYVAMTRAIVQAGKLLDVDVLDHMVIGQGKWV
jgi:DNA repair protein RadC